MFIHELKPAEGAKRKSRKRVGRGTGSGWGKTSGKGQKGQNSRSGVGRTPAFQGGQMPLTRTVPKRGFTNIFKKQWVIVNLDDLNQFEEGIEITPEVLIEKNLIKSVKDGVKILGRGEINKALVIKAHGFSKTAAGKIEAAGGKVEVI